MAHVHNHILRIEALSFSYDGDPFLQNISVDISAGISLIRCEESRGKTTLLRLIAGQLVPQQGSIKMLDANATSEDTVDYQHSVYFLDPRTEEFDQMSAMQYFSLAREKYAYFDNDYIPELVSGLGLTPHQDKPLYMLSAGSKRKVWITAALASGARVTLIDDLTAALDLGSITFITQELCKTARFEKRHMLVSHFDTLANIKFASVIDL